MKTIWIVYPYGEIMGEKYLEARHIRFGRMLAKNGYKVIFWTANFSHGFKKMRSDGWKEINVCDNFDIELVPSSAYKNNISLGRIRFEINYSRSLAKAFEERKAPDLIITAGTGLITAFYPVWPYFKKHAVPTIYDIMDVHLFNSYMEQHHKILLPLAKLLSNNIEKREKSFYENVSAICGLGRNQVDIAIKRTGRPDIPACLIYNSIDVSEFRKKMEYPCQIDFPEKKDGNIWCVYAGSLGPSYDIEAILACAEESDDCFHYIIAGIGPKAKMVEEAAKRNSRITFLGAVDPAWLPSIYQKCDIGLCTYASYSTVDMPDKFYDYVAAGLAVVNSLQGEIKEYVQNVGMQYQAEDSRSLYMAIKKISGNLAEYKNESWKLAERFDWNNQMKTLQDMINAILK